jgi:hypothetical protein
LAKLGAIDSVFVSGSNTATVSRALGASTAINASSFTASLLAVRAGVEGEQGNAASREASRS